MASPQSGRGGAGGDRGDSEGAGVRGDSVGARVRGVREEEETDEATRGALSLSGSVVMGRRPTFRGGLNRLGTKF